jgi:hypothetical protein
MEVDAMDVFGEPILDFGCLALADDAGDAGRPRQSLLRHEEFERAVASTADWNAIDPGLIAVVVTLGLVSSPRRSISSARSSMDMPALILRTFCWLRTSLLKGMSHAAPGVIF